MSASSSDSEDFVMVETSPTTSPRSPQIEPQSNSEEEEEEEQYEERDEEEDVVIHDVVPRAKPPVSKRETLLKNAYKHLPYGDLSPISSMLFMKCNSY